jgi:Ca2+-transporting ATPase
MAEWYQLPVSEVIQKLGVDPARGLDPDEAERRLNQYGNNELVERGVKSPLRLLLEQFTNTMVIILIVAAAVSLYLREYTDAIVIAAIVVLNALLGFSQEYRAEQAMAALKKLAVPKVRVLRNGHIQEIQAFHLVPGDLVLLEAGNVVPADCRLLESVNLRIQEAALTGESEAVEKDAALVADRALPLGDRRNMAYMGTVVSYGRGQAVVTETGMQTELGHIATLIQSVGAEQTPLQKRLDQLGKGLAVAALGLVGVIFVLGWLRGEDFETLFLTSVSIAVAAVPEGLPAVVTIALAMGSQRMLRRNALIRKLPAVETLGSVTTICSDKTGTLTENRMTVTVLDVANHRIDLNEDLVPEGRLGGWTPCEDRGGEARAAAQVEDERLFQQRPALNLLLTGGALCNDALVECDGRKPGSFHVVGDPTEGALVIAAERMGMEKKALESAFPRVAELPFDSVRKRMTTVHRFPDDESRIPDQFKSFWNWGGWIGRVPYVAFTKGAVDGLMTICTRVWLDDHTEPIDETWKERIAGANAQLAAQGMRVLGVAVRSLEALPEKGAQDGLETDLTLVGLVGMIDPARPEVKEAVATCKSAGIRPVMITGDHPLTAQHIARELGILDQGRVLTGQELDGMPVERLQELVDEVPVFARVSPEHKLNIVQAFQNRGQIVAMTGDGVNDAPALKKADIGVAMGITGTDVSKEASDMILLDDNFATIVAAVKEGRVIYDNIRKFVRYLTTCNSGEIWVMLLGPLLGMPLPLLPLQILWMNLVTDGLPALSLSVEAPERDVMQRPPHPPGESIFSRGLGRDVIWVGLLMGLVSLALGFFFWRAGSPAWQTVVFSTLTFSQLFLAFAVRSERDSIFEIGPWSNRANLGAVLATFMLQLGVVYIPFVQGVFKTVPLAGGELALCLALSSLPLWAIELEKWIARRR